MKLTHIFSNKIKLIVLFSIIFKSSIVFSDQNIEKEFKDITSKLRCMTCQNQTIYDSEADFSINIKKIIRQKLNSGENEKKIIQFIEERYGEYILFEPKFDKKNIFLWTFPFIILCLSLVFLFIRIKGNKDSK
tara:strand:+ start:2022 stop:2420 length:399 start_codon:yes stop_codon:yes gene_type:complete